MDGMDLQLRVVRLESFAAQLRGAARRTAGTAAVDWKSLAANRFRMALTQQATSVQACAAMLDDAAQALAAHLQALQLHSVIGQRPEPQPVVPWPAP
jgi:hypothetical protein